MRWHDALTKLTRSGIVITTLFRWAVAAVFLSVLSSPSQAEQADLFVLAGQSNMAGWRGDAVLYPVDPKKRDSQISLFWILADVGSSNGAWATLGPQAGLFPAGHFGPEVTFSRHLIAAGYKPSIFKATAGSTSLAGAWRAPGAHGLYDAMTQQLDKAIALKASTSASVKVRALVWVQGESDAETDDMAATYEKNLSTLIADFRNRVVKSPKLPVILGVDEQHPWVQQRPIIVMAQKHLAQADSCIVFTSMNGLPKADSTHLTPTGLTAHGVLLAKAYLSLAKQCG